MVTISALAWILLLSAEPAPLRVGISQVSPYLSMPAGLPEGFPVAVVNEAAARSGVRVAWVRVDHRRWTLEESLREQVVDLWTTAAVTETRSREFHQTAPWWSQEVQLLAPLEMEQPRRIAVLDTTATRELSGRLFPGSEMLTARVPEDVVGYFCRGEAEALFIDEIAMQQFLLDRPPGCRMAPLRLRHFREANLQTALTAHRSRARDAERLRAAMQGMADEGRIAQLADSYWTVPTGGARRAILEAQERQQRLALQYSLGAVFFGFLLVVVFHWRQRRYVRQLERAEEALRGSENRLQKAQELARLGYWDSDFVTGKLKWSPLAYAIHDVPEEVQLTREFFWNQVHPEDRSLVEAAVERTRREGTPYQVTHRIVTRSGATRWLRQYAEAVRDATGEVTGMQGAVLDITDIKLLEAELHHAQKMESLGRLAGGIAHDFNNLLTVINGYSEMLVRQAAVGLQGAKGLEAIRQAGERAAELTRQLLSFSRKEVIEPAPHEVNRAVEELRRLLDRVLGEKIAARFETAKEPLWVRIDAGQLQQVLMNLAVNARDAMPEGGTLRITVRREEGETAWASIAVEDTGIGIPAQNRELIFEPFFTTRNQGTGLGLAIVRGVVMEAGGTVKVEAREGKGARIVVRLPLIPPPETRREDPPLRVVEAGPLRVLLVEDDRQVRRFVAEVVAAGGHEVLEAGDAKAAWERIEREGWPEVVITDVVLPGASGVELARRLRAERPDLPVVLVSGYPDEEAGDIMALSGPGLHFLRKPFTPDELMQTIGQAMVARRER
jgi:signal transduction histidine kinase/ActR/RegA family two-component response regulator